MDIALQFGMTFDGKEGKSCVGFGLVVRWSDHKEDNWFLFFDWVSIVDLLVVSRPFLSIVLSSKGGNSFDRNNHHDSLCNCWRIFARVVGKILFVHFRCFHHIFVENGHSMFEEVVVLEETCSVEKEVGGAVCLCCGVDLDRADLESCGTQFDHDKKSADVVGVVS